MEGGSMPSPEQAEATFREAFCARSDLRDRFALRDSLRADVTDVWSLCLQFIASNDNEDLLYEHGIFSFETEFAANGGLVSVEIKYEDPGYSSVAIEEFSFSKSAEGRFDQTILD
jgi:hypothetical protein